MEQAVLKQQTAVISNMRSQIDELEALVRNTAAQVLQLKVKSDEQILNFGH